MTSPPFRLLALSLTCLTAGAGCGTSQAASKPATSTRASASLADEMVAAHNEMRAKTKPTPKPALPKLTWSPEAARVARAWANQCHFEHNKNRGKYGENLAAAAPPGTKSNAQVVYDWASESAHYSYAKNSCAPGEVCGHYTQVVWRDTTQVGCAIATCTKNSPFGARFPTWQLWVCNYTPPGNYVGRKPY